jgi:regulatory protein
MKINSIKQQVKNPERVSVFIDGKYKFSLSLGELVEQKLKAGLEIDELRLEALKKISDDGKLRNRAIEWVLNRPRSTKEFIDYMRRKKADPDLTSKLIEEFQDKNYLSNVKFAIWLTELRRRSGKSERAIKSELLSKGVDHSEISNAMADGDDELIRLRLFVNKKRKLSRYANDDNKFKQYLISKGFSYQDIKTVLKD